MSSRGLDKQIGVRHLPRASGAAESLEQLDGQVHRNIAYPG